METLAEDERPTEYPHDTPLTVMKPVVHVSSRQETRQERKARKKLEKHAIEEKKARKREKQALKEARMHQQNAEREEMRAQWQDKDRLKAKHERQQGKEIVMAEKALQRAAREADREEESLRAQQQVLSTRLAPTVTAAVVYKKERPSCQPRVQHIAAPAFLPRGTTKVYGKPDLLRGYTTVPDNPPLVTRHEIPVEKSLTTPSDNAKLKEVSARQAEINSAFARLQLHSTTGVHIPYAPSSVVPVDTPETSPPTPATPMFVSTKVTQQTYFVPATPVTSSLVYPSTTPIATTTATQTETATTTATHFAPMSPVAATTSYMPTTTANQYTATGITEVERKAKGLYVSPRTVTFSDVATIKRV